jgi:hypothetical protein
VRKCQCGVGSVVQKENFKGTYFGVRPFQQTFLLRVVVTSKKVEKLSSDPLANFRGLPKSLGEEKQTSTSETDNRKLQQLLG